jgi:NAD(P)H dehydrogenase (quinone)
MHALIVVAHPDRASLSHGVAAHVGEGVSLSGPGNSFEIADLAVEGFDPRFTEADLAVHRREAQPPADIIAEQVRIDPVYWWSMPALLKGWIDRVFANGWAYDEGPDTPMVKKLGHLPVHLVAIGGASLRTYARHGYFGAMKTQIDDGIFDYCGAPVVTSELLLGSGQDDPAKHLAAARAVGGTLFKAFRPTAAQVAA